MTGQESITARLSLKDVPLKEQTVYDNIHCSIILFDKTVVIELKFLFYYDLLLCLQGSSRQ